MLRLLRRWPPATWLVVYVGSALIIMGSRSNWGMLVAGIVLTLVAFALSIWLALGDRSVAGPRPPVFHWALGGVAVFYLLAAVIAAFADPAYGVATLLAGIVPATAVALVLATTRAKTVRSGGRLRDTSADDENDPYPGIGMDDDTPVGATTEHAGPRKDPWAKRRWHFHNRDASGNPRP
jgi:hypothetical protein